MNKDKKTLHGYFDFKGYMYKGRIVEYQSLPIAFHYIRQMMNVK